MALVEGGVGFGFGFGVGFGLYVVVRRGVVVCGVVWCGAAVLWCSGVVVQRCGVVQRCVALRCVAVRCGAMRCVCGGVCIAVSGGARWRAMVVWGGVEWGGPRTLWT